MKLASGSLISPRSRPGSRSAPIPTSDALRAACTLSLLLASGLHIGVGVEHAGSSFGALSLAAGLAQAALAVALLNRPSSRAFRVSIALNVALVLLYVLNVTVGLPPPIAHSHSVGEHRVWLVTLAWPGPLSWQGLTAVSNEMVVLACAVFIRRGTASGRAWASGEATGDPYPAR